MNDLDLAAAGAPGTWATRTAATAELDPPYAVLDRGALAANAADLVRRAGGVPIRVASKSIRTRAAIDALLAMPGFHGVLGYTLAESIWLARHGVTDVVVGYPTVDRGAIARLAADETLASRVTLMVDSVAQLDVVDAVVAPSARPAIRVAIDLDASWRSRVLGHIGVFRSPIHSPVDAKALAAAIAARRGFRLVGMMAYEAQIAGVQDAVAGQAFNNALMRWVKSRSIAELHDRRAAAVRGGPRHRRARVRERRRHRLARVHVVGFERHGARGGERALRPDLVRRGTGPSRPSRPRPSR